MDVRSFKRCVNIITSKICMNVITLKLCMSIVASNICKSLSLVLLGEMGRSFSLGRPAKQRSSLNIALIRQFECHQSVWTVF